MTAALSGLVVAGAVWGTAPLCIALVVVTGSFLRTWPDLVGIPGARGGTVLAALAASASLALLIAVPTMADPPRPLTPVAPVLGVALALAFIHQLVRDHPRDRVVASLTATTAAMVLAVLGTLALPAQSGPGGARLLAAGLAGAVGGVVVLASPLGSAVGAARAAPVVPVVPIVPTIPAVLVGAAVGLSVEAAALGSNSVVTPTLELAAGALAGGGTAVAAVAAMAAVAAGAVAGPHHGASRRLAAAGALPVLSAGPFAYVIGVLLWPDGSSG